MAKYSEEKVTEIIRLYVEEEKTQKEIADIFGTYNTTIRRILQRNNIPIRSNSQIQRLVELEDIKKHEGTESFDYFIGVLITDGCNTNGAIVLDFAEADKEILDYWNEFLGNKCNINVSYHKVYNTPQYRIAFRNPEIVKYLESFGIVPRKTFNVKLNYVNWNVLRGIIDGDGSIITDKRNDTKRITITSGFEPFLIQIQDFLNGEDIVSYIHKRDNYYVLSVNRQEFVYKMWENMYSNATYFLKRKYEKYGSLVKKFSRCNSVNSGKENSNSNPEPSLRNEEGAETRHGEPKSDLSDMVKV